MINSGTYRNDEIKINSYISKKPRTLCAGLFYSYRLL